MTNKAVPVLPTKLYTPPPRKASVSRARLIGNIDAGLDRKFTLVSAPAGYGKSTLLSAWAGQARVPLAWLSLDRGDNDPPRFWAYFVAALHTIPGLESSWSGAQVSGILPVGAIRENDSFLVDLISKIAGAPWRFVLILDDLQAITAEPILDGLFYLLENLPAGNTGMHLIAASRNDPPWPLARLRAGGQITEIRASDLSFTPDETTAFINDVMGLALSPAEISALDQRTEGWAAGLQMAALSMQGRDDLAGFLSAFTGSHRFVLDYLVEEVLDRQSPETLDFLLKTSVLERLTGSLCDAVTGNRDGAERLLQLERANLFLVALDDQRTWYRYHHLFADLLRKQLRAKHPGQIHGLHRQASQWYAQAGSPLEAVAHALNTEDWAFAANKIEAYIPDLIQNGELALIRQWLNPLPDEVIHPRPVLCIAQALTSAQYATVDRAEELLARAKAALENDSSADGPAANQDVVNFVSTQAAVLQVIIARARGDSTQRQQELALEALNQIVPPGDTGSRAGLFVRLGLCYLDLGKDDEADSTFSQASELGLSSGNYYAAHAASYGRMVIARRHGQLNTLAEICRQTLHDSTLQAEGGRSLNGIALVMSGGLSYERNDLSSAASQLDRGLDMVARVGIPELLVKGDFALSCLKIVQGKQTHLPDLAKMAETSYPGLVRYAVALRVRLSLLTAIYAEGLYLNPEAIGWAETRQLTFTHQSSYDWEMQEILIYARVLCKQYQADPSTGLTARIEAVLDFIQGQIQTLIGLGWQGILIEAYAVISLILHSIQRETEALSILGMALELGESQNYLRTFVDEGPLMRELLQGALAEGSHTGYARKLLTAFENQGSPSHPETSPQPGVLHDHLSERELQVLRLLNTRLSVPEIAAQIHLAPATVRTHVQHIYQKLGVHGRIEAIQKAQEIRLL